MTKKFFFCLLPALFLFSIGLFGCANHRENATLTPVTLNEVAHSVFYAPLYVSIENGYFKEEDIGLSLVTGFGADKTMTAVLSGEADIGFMGPETTVYAASEGASDTVVNFAQLTQRAGNFLVARAPSDTFSWDDVKGKTVLGGRKGGMPEMVFEYVLRQNGIDPAADLVNVHCRCVFRRERRLHRRIRAIRDCIGTGGRRLCCHLARRGFRLCPLHRVFREKKLFKRKP